MELLNNIKTLLRYPSIIFRPNKRILLLSHMRANTSVFGHVLGSNPEIEGYYELHIGYYSWKSFMRQKLMYFAEHAPKKSAKYMFDKVLHNEHKVNLDIFNDEDIVIIMVREPTATIASIQKLYAEVDPTHSYNEYSNAEKYYFSRLDELVNLARQLKNKYYFMHAESLTQSPDSILKSLSNILGLSAALSKKYQILKKTGQQGAGDSSSNMGLGEIKQKETVAKDLSGLPVNHADKYYNSVDELQKLAIREIK